MLKLGTNATNIPNVVGTFISPSDIPGLDLHLKVNTGIVAASGNTSAAGNMSNGEDINSWADQSGNNRHASQGTASKKPHFSIGTYGLDFGGLRWTDDATDPHMNLASNVSIAADQDFTIMIRVRLDGFDNLQGIIGSAAQNVIKWTHSRRVVVLIGGVDGSNPGGEASTFEESEDPPIFLDLCNHYIHTLTRSGGSNGNLEYRIHGHKGGYVCGEPTESYFDKSWDAAENHTDSDAFVINNIGCAADGAIPAQGVFKDVIIWKGTALTTAQRQDMYTYIEGQSCFHATYQNINCNYSFNYAAGG